MASNVEADPSVFPGHGDAELHELVAVGTDLTFGTAEHFRRRITDLLTLHEVRVILDLRGLERMDAVGLGALVAARRRLHASHGCLHLVVGPVALQRLSSSGLIRFFDIAPDPEAATEHSALPTPRQPAVS